MFRQRPQMAQQEFEDLRALITIAKNQQTANKNALIQAALDAGISRERVDAAIKLWGNYEAQFRRGVIR